MLSEQPVTFPVIANISRWPLPRRNNISKRARLPIKLWEFVRKEFGKREWKKSEMYDMRNNFEKPAQENMHKDHRDV